MPSLAWAVHYAAIAALVGMVGLQWAGLKVSARFQEWTTAVKFLAFLAIVVAAFALPHAAPARASAASGSPTTLTSLILALQAVVIAYGGWQSALYFTEEDTDPTRNLPRAMIGGLVSVIVVYVLVNLALLAVLSIPDLAASKLPGADAAAILAGDRGHEFITILSLISLLPLLNAIMMIGPRILFAMGRDGLFWTGTASVNPGGTPGVATLLTTGVAVALIATGTFETLIAMVSFFLAANYAVCCLALVVLRRREPGLARPFRTWGYPWTAAIVVVGAIAFLGGVLVGDAPTAARALGLLALGVVGWMALGRRGESRVRT